MKQRFESPDALRSLVDIQMPKTASNPVSHETSAFLHIHYEAIHLPSLETLQCYEVPYI